MSASHADTCGLQPRSHLPLRPCPARSLRAKTTHSMGAHGRTIFHFPTGVCTTQKQTSSTRVSQTSQSRRSPSNRRTSRRRAIQRRRTQQTQKLFGTSRKPYFQYTAQGMPILRQGAQGSEVVTLQTRLKKRGFLKGNVDGDFGKQTLTAVKAFQKRYGLEDDGVVGGATWRTLLRK